MISLSEELGVGLLVVGGRGQGRIERILMGSHSEDIVHCAHLPVLVLRHGAVWPPTRLVIGDDYSEDAKEAASLARGLGGLFGIREAVLVHAYPPLLEEVSEGGLTGYAVQAEQESKSRVAELEGVLGYGPQTKLVPGDAAVAILETARESDGSTLVAVGSRGLGRSVVPGWEVPPRRSSGPRRAPSSSARMLSNSCTNAGRSRGFWVGCYNIIGCFWQNVAPVL